MPEEWDGEQVDLLLVTNSEATLWLDGEPVQGLVSGGEHLRADAMLTPSAPSAGETLSARVEIACNGLFGWSELIPQPQRPAAIPPAVPPRALRARALRPRGVGARLRPRRARRADGRAGGRRRLARRAAARAQPLLQRVGRGDRATWSAAARSSPRCCERRNATRTHEITAVGHAHIDTAWLWPLEETYRKCVRTFATQLRLMERYPGYRFACSQAQQYAWIRDREPGLWERIRDARSRAGQWLPVGGTWIEPDCNLPPASRSCASSSTASASSSASSAAAPRCSGTPTSSATTASCRRSCAAPGSTASSRRSCSWNRFNPPEHHTFRWVGIDGSAVLAHFPPADTYNAEATVPELRRAARDFKDHALSAHSLLVFGWGDGGGGPTARDARDARARARTCRTSRARRSATRRRSSRALAEEADWPEVVGELYLEYHRGTYTTQARTKRASRRARARAARRRAARRRRRRAVAARGARAAPGRRSCSTTSTTSSRARRSARSTRAPSATWPRWRRPPERCATGLAGAPARCGQHGRRGAARGRRDAPTACVFAEAPPCGVGRLVEPRDGGDASRGRRRLRARERAPARGPRPRRHAALAGQLASGREAMAAPGNVLELYDDAPPTSRRGTSTRSISRPARDCPRGHAAPRSSLADPLRAEVAFERPIGRRSRMRQTVRLDAESARLEFHCEIDWHEDRTALKVRFPVAVHAPRATYEMQFGVVERPTHYSTRRDLAQFEVPGHRFADLSEHGFGVALLSAATYGWSRPRQRDAHDAAALAAVARPARPTSATTSSPSRSTRTAAAGRRPASPPRRCASTRRCCSASERGEPRSWFSTDAPGAPRRHRQARRGRRRADRPPLRGPRRARHGPPARRRPVHRGVVHQPARGPPRAGAGRRRRGRHPLPAVRDRDRRARYAGLDCAAWVSTSWRR